MISFYAQHFAREGEVKRALQAEEVAGTNTVSAAANPGERGFWFGKLSHRLPYDYLVSSQALISLFVSWDWEK